MQTLLESLSKLPISILIKLDKYLHKFQLYIPDILINW